MKMSDVARIVQGYRQGNDHPVESISIDTRTLKPGDLFFALTGPNFDGNAYVGDALAKGAIGAVVRETNAADVSANALSSKGSDSLLNLPENAALIKVADVKLALGQFAKAWKQQFTFPTIALTGSCGKTSVKEMIALILAEQGLVLATQGNKNNDIGVPLMLARATESIDYAVFELGANHAGEIGYTASLVEPDVGFITNAGSAHLEGFGSVEGVAKAKSEIYDHIKKDGTAIVNADDAYASLWLEKSSHLKQLTFSARPDSTADYRLQFGEYSTEGSVLDIVTPEGVIHITLGLLGRHHWQNALAAVAATHALGISLTTIATALARAVPAPGRLNPKASIFYNTLVIDDTYNANPSSVRAAIDVLAEFTSSGSTILILGDMGELGDVAVESHRGVGEYAQQQRIHRLIAIGEFAEHTIAGFGSDRGVALPNQQALGDLVEKTLAADANESNITVLVKGSRSAKMENIVDALCPQGQL